MTTKEYLKQIKRYDVIIKRKKREIKSLASDRVLVSGIDYSLDKVQTSPNGAGFTEQSDRVLDRIKELREDVISLEAKRQKIIDKIYALPTADHITVLCDRYVEDMRIDDIAAHMGYTYDYILRLHKRALTEFDSVHKTVHKIP